MKKWRFSKKMESPKFKKKIGSKGGYLSIVFPKEVVEWLNLKIGEEIIIQPETGKYGKFLAIYIDTTGETNDTKTTDYI